MAPPVHVQFPATAFANSTGVQITVTGVAPGNLLVAGLLQEGSFDPHWQNFAISDDKANAWNPVVFASTFRAVIYRAQNVSSGNTVISASWDFTRPVRIGVAEVSSAHTSTAVDATGSFVDAGGVSTHFCADSSNIDTAPDVYVFAAGVTSGIRTHSTGAGYTALEGSSLAFYQFRTSASSLTDERGPFASDSPTQGWGAMASFIAASTGGGGGGSLRPPGSMMRGMIGR